MKRITLKVVETKPPRTWKHATEGSTLVLSKEPEALPPMMVAALAQTHGNGAVARASWPPYATPTFYFLAASGAVAASLAWWLC